MRPESQGIRKLYKKGYSVNVGVIVIRHRYHRFLDRINYLRS